MARIPLPYKTENNLTELLIMEQARRATVTRGTARPSLKELEEELATYCNVTQDTINLLRRNKHQPSLPVAIKVCEYLQVQVDEVFKLIVNPDFK
ncbi:helix-turn-helix transcriptional regulator [Paenibacillus amylolyticus]|uniref:DNA-binding helix-turn-helix protein n=1 Tax=Paenibacillus amylolyticus TaxID=1451 RepID=A0A117I1D0_PAEAM|nr:helix-turn-helix domain-containing protein [Paenibacillus amylolyticus]GAS81975.1 DNA-binding helix-turn-helix protein [Paenibacillus amylolyticus]